MRTHRVQGGEGLQLHVCEWGRTDAPSLLFLHGWSQHHRCWQAQYESELSDEFRLVAVDLRGHGKSEAPLEAGHYTRGELWAEDVRALIDSLALGPPILIGWSYGGFIIGDYLRCHGDSGIAGVNLVAAAIGIGPGWFGRTIGPGFLDHAPPACSDDEAIARAAIHAFVHEAAKKPLAPALVRDAIDWSQQVDPKVRAALIDRVEDFIPELAQLRKPTLVTYGEADTVILPAMAKRIGEVVSHAELSAYAGVGHLPFLEEPKRFNAELAAFARRTFGLN